MSVRRVLRAKGFFVPVIRSGLTLNDVINQLEVDNVGALVVTDDSSRRRPRGQAHSALLICAPAGCLRLPERPSFKGACWRENATSRDREGASRNQKESRP